MAENVRLRHARRNPDRTFSGGCSWNPYLLIDHSGSMTTEKKYIAKSFFFWLVRFLKLKY
jgi:uncharacterized sporulation protein YeaH/YhbH (DUF444 family)